MEVQFGAENGTRDEDESKVTRSVIRKTYLRVVVLLMIAYLFAMLDRVSVGVAALEMNRALSFTATIFSTGAGLFFVGYALFEIPSVIVGGRFGARRWICRCLVTWGAFTALTATVHSPLHFHILRFLTGVAEAGFYPLALFYIAKWIPREYRGSANSLFIFGATLSHIVGSPISGFLLGLEGWFGIQGWQWLFIIEGIATIIFGVVIYMCLDDRIDDVSWLTTVEKDWLSSRVEGAGAGTQGMSWRSSVSALTSRNVWIFGLAFAGLLAAFYGFLLWFPQAVAAAGFTNAQTGLLAGLPSLVGSIILFLWAAHSDRVKEQAWHTALPLLAASVAAVVCAIPSVSNSVLFLALLILSIGVLIAMPVFWTMATRFLPGTELASAFAAISSIGNLGGFAGSYVMGWVKDHTGSLPSAFAALAIFPFIAAVLLVFMRYSSVRQLSNNQA